MLGKREPSMVEIASYWLVCLVFRRILGFVYLLAFIGTATQFTPLLGENGVLPLTQYAQRVRFRDAPSLFHQFPNDTLITGCAWLGVGLSILAVTGIPALIGTVASVLLWGVLWLLYLSFVNAGRTFYAFGWESLLLETGFLAIFLGGMATTTPDLVVWLLRWVLFRVMFGAGLIKLRGDECWREFTCLFYHYETQPMPNPLSWYFDKLPGWIQTTSIGVHHVVELVVPFLYFAPQPIAAIAGILTILYQLWLMVSGNFAWLNFLTIVLAISTFNDALLGEILSITPPATHSPSAALSIAVLGLTLLVVVLSYWPVRNMLSSQQSMNRSFDPLHLVNTYGAFGSITRDRYELVIEGTHDDHITDETDWHAYEFKGKPTDPGDRPPQWAPYHLRLDWQLWFAAMTPRPRRRWFPRFIQKLLEGDDNVLSLLDHNPFPDDPPTHIRVQRYRYRYTTRDERRETGDWWHREAINDYYGPISLDEQGRHRALGR
jgi:hypothetical protein